MKAADISGKKQNRARGAVSASEAAAIREADKPPKKRKVPTDLDSRMFAHRVGMASDESNETIIAAKNAYSAYASALDQLYDREITIKSDRTKTATDHDLRVSKMADNAIDPVAKRGDAARDRLNNEISRIDGQIQHDTKARMTPAEQQEIRGYVRSLSDEQRRSFLSRADDDTLSAVLAGKPFLSGLSPAEALKADHDWRNRKFPELNALKARFERARELIEEGWSRYLREVSALRDPHANTVEAQMEAADAAVKAAVNLDD